MEIGCRFVSRDFLIIYFADLLAVNSKPTVASVAIETHYFLHGSGSNIANNRCSMNNPKYFESFTTTLHVDNTDPKMEGFRRLV